MRVAQIAATIKSPDDEVLKTYFEKYKDDFWRMVNSLSVLKEGPAGPLFRP